MLGKSKAVKAVTDGLFNTDIGPDTSVGKDGMGVQVYHQRKVVFGIGKVDGPGRSVVVLVLGSEAGGEKEKQ